MSNQINVYDLHRLALTRRQRERECFMTVLEKCYSRIRRTNAIYKSQCDFDVPIFIMGRPLFDIETCIKFMIRNLSGNGYVVHFYPPRTLHISWSMTSYPALSSSPVENRNNTRRVLQSSRPLPLPLPSSSLSVPSSDNFAQATSSKPRRTKPNATASNKGGIDTTTTRPPNRPPLLEDAASVVTSKSTSGKRSSTQGNAPKMSKEERNDRNNESPPLTSPPPPHPRPQVQSQSPYPPLYHRGEGGGFLQLPQATRSTDFKSKKDEDGNNCLVNVLTEYEKERKRQDEAIKKAMPRPKSQAQFHKSIAEFKPSGRFSLASA